jgi:hypothetical protein
VVHFLQGRSYHFFDLAEIDKNAVCFERLASQDHLYFPVMSMEVFTLAAKLLEVMCRGKTTDDFQFKETLLQENPPSARYIFLPAENFIPRLASAPKT